MSDRHPEPKPALPRDRCVERVEEDEHASAEAQHALGATPEEVPPETDGERRARRPGRGWIFRPSW